MVVRKSLSKHRIQIQTDCSQSRFLNAKTRETLPHANITSTVREGVGVRIKEEKISAHWVHVGSASVESTVQSGDPCASFSRQSGM